MCTAKRVTNAGTKGVFRDEDEEPMAYIVRKPGSEISAGDILNYMGDKTSKIKWITGGIVFCNMIPKNPVRAAPPFLVWV